MNVFLILLGSFLGLLGVLYPFYQKKYENAVWLQEFDQPSQREVVREKKANLMLVFKELDFDFETGKLSKEDYKDLRLKYEKKVVIVMKELEQLEEKWKQIGEEVDRTLA